MATKSENADIRELQTNMKSVTSDINEMKTDIKTILSNQDIAFKQLEAKKADKSELKTFKWITIPLTVVATTVITLLVQDWLANRKTEQPTNQTSSGSTIPSVEANASAQSSTGKPQDSESVTEVLDGVLPKGF